jgi:hypothetical protein
VRPVSLRTSLRPEAMGGMVSGSCAYAGMGKTADW